MCIYSLAIGSTGNWTLMMELNDLRLGQTNVAPPLAITSNVLLASQSIDGTPIRALVMTGRGWGERRRRRRWAE